MMTARTRNNQLLWVLLLCTSTARQSHAFMLPTKTTTFVKLLPTNDQPSTFRLAVSTSPTLRSTDRASGDSDYPPLPYTNLHEANRALDILANKCGVPGLESVVSRADECQSTWEIMRSTSSSIQPDTVSLNLVLKAWSKCCQSLAESKKHAIHSTTTTTTTTSPSTSSSSSSSDHHGGGIHNDHHPQVYTAKDAAERATLLLLSQEQEYQNHILPESARPDVYSYNEVIGRYSTIPRTSKMLVSHTWLLFIPLLFLTCCPSWSWFLFLSQYYCAIVFFFLPKTFLFSSSSQPTFILSCL